MADYHEKLANDLIEMRRALLRIEGVLGAINLPIGDESNSYEKTVVLVKVGIKLMKKELAKHGQLKIGRRAKDAEGY